MANITAKTTLTIQKTDDGAVTILGSLKGVPYAWSSKFDRPWVKGESSDELIEAIFDQINKFGAYFIKRSEEGVDKYVKTKSAPIEDMDADDLTATPAPKKAAKKPAKPAKEADDFGYEQAI